MTNAPRCDPGGAVREVTGVSDREASAPTTGAATRRAYHAHDAVSSAASVFGPQPTAQAHADTSRARRPIPSRERIRYHAPRSAGRCHTT